ncbi:MAG: tRNA pseudouridine(38-40) synthase TruA [Alphaproteobacteria bacterium]|nr:tRNA pseudouridine(38-40) synthase TruA [Alphaproteobacteria bacterium]
MRYKLLLEYDGTPFIGWQKQAGNLSVQGVLETALKTALRETIIVWGSGRTDAGVHALGQVAHFETEQSIDTYKLFESLNALVRPYPIVIRAIEQTADTFHARFSAKQRSYVYKIQNTPYPAVALTNLRAWWIRTPLDIDKMQQAANLLLGKHDFSTFRASECQAKSPVKTLDTCEIKKNGENVEIWVSAKSFLHHQVRNIAGALVRVGTDKWSVQDFKKAFEACDRTKGAETAPAHGLYFVQVKY